MAGSSRPGDADPDAARIYAALVEIAGTRGYPDTSLAMVLDRAGVSESAFHSRFRDLDQSFEQAWEVLAAEFAGALETGVPDGVGWRERMRAATGAAAEFFAGDPAPARLLLLEADRRASTRALRDANLARLAAAIDTARADLPDPSWVSSATAEAIAGSLYDLVVARLRKGDVGEASSLAGELRYLIVMPYWGVRAAEAELNPQGD